MTVQLDSMDTFVEELERDAADGKIENEIVRLTLRIVGRLGGVIPTIAVVAAYRARGDVVEHVAVCGELWSLRLEPESSAPFAERDAPTREKRAETEKAVRDLCEQHKLDLRSGRFR